MTNVVCLYLVSFGSSDCGCAIVAIPCVIEGVFTFAWLQIRNIGRQFITEYRLAVVQAINRHCGYWGPGVDFNCDCRTCRLVVGVPGIRHGDRCGAVLDSGDGSGTVVVSNGSHARRAGRDLQIIQKICTSSVARCSDGECRRPADIQVTNGFRIRRDCRLEFLDGISSCEGAGIIADTFDFYGNRTCVCGVIAYTISAFVGNCVVCILNQ